MEPKPHPVRGLATGTEITVPLVRPPKQGKDETAEEFERRRRRIARYLAAELVVRRLDHKVVRRLAHELDRLESAVRALQSNPETTPEQLEAGQEAVLDHHRKMLLLGVQTWAGQDVGPALVRVLGVELEFQGGTIERSEEKPALEVVRWLEQLDLLELAGGALLLAQEPTKDLGN